MQKPYMIRVSSSKGGVGKSVISINLAVALRSLGYKVLIIDEDTVNPCVGIYLGLPDASTGLMDVMLGKADINRCIIPHPSTGLRVLPGVISSKQSKAENFKPSLKQIKIFTNKLIKLGFDFIIIDTQPGIQNPDAMALLDEALLVALPYTASAVTAVKMLSQYGKAKLKCSIVINEMRNKAYELSVREIEEMCEIRVSGTLPFDENVQMGVSDHIPVYNLNKRAPFSKSVLELARMYSTRIDTVREDTSGQSGEGIISKILGIFKIRVSFGSK